MKATGTKTCRSCGKTGLRWVMVNGRWRLFNGPDEHQCDPKAQSAPKPKQSQPSKTPSFTGTFVARIHSALRPILARYVEQEDEAIQEDYLPEVVNAVVHDFKRTQAELSDSRNVCTQILQRYQAGEKVFIPEILSGLHKVTNGKPIEQPETLRSFDTASASLFSDEEPPF